MHIINGNHHTIGIFRPLTTQSVAAGESLQGKGVLGSHVQEQDSPALCFGWIDSTLKKLPDRRLAQRLSPRRKNSHWTKLNMDRCIDLEDRGLMTPAGRWAYQVSHPTPEQEKQMMEEARARRPGLYENRSLDNE